jgi:phosphoribosyl-ATP pyrophosphohydrolase
MVNINDTTAPEVQGDMLEAIFDRQLELLNKYDKIEASNGFFVPRLPIDLNDAKTQYRLKDYFWRVTEELAEAIEAYEHHNHQHFIEELIDSLHFIVEAMIVVGITPEDLAGQRKQDKLEGLMEMATVAPLPLCFMKTVTHLGLAANCLKNKPWKQTQMLTDELNFKAELMIALRHLTDILKGAGLSARDIHDIYFKKSEVNKFRQDSGY